MERAMREMQQDISDQRDANEAAIARLSHRVDQLFLLCLVMAGAVVVVALVVALVVMIFWWGMQ